MDKRSDAWRQEMRRRLLVYAVTDRSWIGVQTLLEQIESTLVGGATLIQLREKNLDLDSFVREALEVKRLCEKYGVPLIINDNVDVALQCHADGVHVGQGDMDPSLVRSKIGFSSILGVSVQTVEQARKAEEASADYIGVGAVFPTQTKTDAESVKLGVLKTICSSVSVPVVAIGGVSMDNIEQLDNTGVAGVAVVSAVFGQPDIEMATFNLASCCRSLFE